MSLVQGIVDLGTNGVVIDTECHSSNGIPNIIIVGFANKAVDEAKERLRSAFATSNLNLPRKRITINLAPADIPKDSTGFDLAMAFSILSDSQQVSQSKVKDCIFIGELGLDGAIRPVRGIIGKLLAGRSHGFAKYYIPQDNLEQALLVPDIEIVPAKTLYDLYLHLADSRKLKTYYTKEGIAPESQTNNAYETTLDDIVGQAQAKRGLEIVAAGGHNILFNGPPGTGKSMLAKSLISILPPLSHEEILEVTHIHSLVTKDYDQIVTTRPFRTPHHSASDTAIIGGGQNPQPGEISLSHRGVLFLDELPEFTRSSIESLRQPLEDKKIVVSRAKTSVNYPANFILVATANPCPCGYYGSHKACQCMPHQIIKYQKKVSGPILDRIDLHLAVEQVAHEKLLSNDSKKQQGDLRQKRILKARGIQAKRYGSTQKLNSDMANKDIKQFAQLNEEARELLNKAAKQLDVSARSYMKTVKVARTIADLEQSNYIEAKHIAEALQYRPQQYQFNL